MAKTPPATALAALGGSGGSKSVALPHQQQPQPPPQLQQQGGGGNSNYGHPRGKRGSRRHNRGGGGGHSGSGSGFRGMPGNTGAPPAAPTANYYNPWTGSIYMWPGPRAPTPPHAPAPPTHQAYVAGPPAQWAGHWASLLSPLSQLHNLLLHLVGISRPLLQALRRCLLLNRHSGTGTSTPVLPATWRPTLVFSLPSPPSRSFSLFYCCWQWQFTSCHCHRHHSPSLQF